MTSPVPDNRLLPAVPSTTADRRRKLARKWTYLLSLSSYLSLPHAEMEDELLDLVNRVLDALVSEPLPTGRIAEIGARLVELHGVGKASLRCTVEVLAGALLSEPEAQRFDRLPERVAQLIGALASGYVDAIQASTMEQQDTLHQALLEFTCESEHKLSACVARLETVLEGSASGIAITDLDGRFVRVNAAFGRLLDDPDRTSLFDLVRAPNEEDLRGAYQDLLDGRREQLALRPELLRRDGAASRVSLTASLVRDEDGNPHDVVTIIAADAELSQPRALPDVVTGLPNREYLIARLNELLHAGRLTTLYVLELDGFALIRDGLGRQTGDSLLRAVGQRLRDVLADTENATVARFEGAVFAVLVASSLTAPDTGTVINRIHQAFAKPVRIADLRVPASLSIGVVHQHSHQADSAELVHAADLALRRARRKGYGQWALYDPDRDDRDRESLALAATMPDAWDKGQLRVGYRPVVRLSDNRVVAIEGLPRWQHPKYGTIPHQRCQELAERTGLILPIGNWLLRRACEQARRKHALPLHVNLTPTQSSDRDLVVRVRQALEETGLPPDRLQLGVPMGSLDNLSGLTAAGVQVAIHHFGGGPEQLAYLEDLDIRAVRLRPSLVRRQTQPPGRGPLMASAVRDLITLVHQLDATVTVDDLTTRAQVHWWLQAGADTATGPLFAHTSLT
jgi:diguanylate cyclase (GGDEF)-like protein/PAS domain S-box-containing protein